MAVRHLNTCSSSPCSKHSCAIRFFCDADVNPVDVVAAESAASTVDEATRRFNFWTHQIHIFFVWKFLPSARLLLETRRRLKSEL